MRVDIHNHSRYSNIRLTDALPTPEQIVDRAISLGLAGVALSDHECLSGHIKMNKYALTIKEEHPDFKIMLANEIYLVDERPSDVHYHYLLVSKDKEGHRQLRILSTIAWLNSYSSKGLERVDTLKSDLERIVRENPGHLIASTACIGGELGKRILSMTAAEHIGDKATVEREHAAIVNFMLWNKELFGDDFYLEVQPGISKEQIIVNQRILSIANCFGVKMIPTSDSHYLSKEDRFVHKSFLNSKEGEREVDAFYQDAYLHSDEEMIEKFTKSNFDRMFVEQMFENSMEIYNKVENYSLAHPQQIPNVDVKDYPKNGGGWYTEDWNAEDFPILKSMFNSDDKIERYWINECVQKLCDINKYNKEYLSRLEEEADIKRTIGEALQTNMFAYPVTLQHYVDLFWECGSMVGAGRGSSCSGLNHYLLGVTQLDPIEWNLPFWRYLNKERFELGDIDLDLCPSKRPAILRAIKTERGANFRKDIDALSRANLGCTLIATFGTESTKSAILTACRGYRSEDCPEGIDVDTAQYLSSLVPQERGFIWPLKEVVYGNPEKDRKPVIPFINTVSEYPGLLDIMFGIEGCISRRSSHASGVILFDEDPFEFGCFMRTPSGEVITQYDLHDAEWCGMTKYDFLVTEVQDKLVQAINFLQENNEIEKELTLREVYNKYFHPSVLPIEDEQIWNNIQNVNVLDLFQFDSDIGSQAAKKIKPSTMLELADANGLMRLMTAEKGAETPMDKYIRFKGNINLWYDEMKRYGLSDEEQENLKPHFLRSHGVPPSQEQLMTMLMDENLCGFSLKDANGARKIVGKKQMSKIPELHQHILDAAKTPALGKYIWECGVGPQMGYSFSVIHALAYSFIGFQTAYIATKWNPIYWNTACLVANSGSLEETKEEIVDIYEKENMVEFDYEDLPDRAGKKKKEKTSDYAKVAKAIGNIRDRGIEVSLVNINKSDYSFKPDIENNRILYGLKGLSNINSEIIDAIKAGRPYANIKDFLARCPIKKTAIINLIKAGAFDEIEGFDSRVKTMIYYINIISEPKSKLNLQNFNGLIQHGLVPKELELEIRVYNFNKYLKSFKVGKYYTLDDAAIGFCNKFIHEEVAEYLEVINGISCILQSAWDKVYQAFMDIARVWLKDNQKEILEEYNFMLFKETWEKYATGNTSAWEMSSVCFYHGEHELKDVNYNKYGIVDYESLPSEPRVDYFFKRNGREIPIYKIYKIIGTVIAKNDSRHSISLLTTTGVVSVKFTGEYYSMFKKQISEKQADGKKKVMEKSWFTRGTKLMIAGFRRDDQFVAKTYKNTGCHQLYKITDVLDDDIKITHDRYSSSNSIEEEENVYQ